MNLRRARASDLSFSAFFLILFFAACGGGNNGGGGGGGGGTPPSTPTGLTATPGNAQVSLSWNASAGTTSYRVGRSATSGGPYSQIASPAATNYTDTSLTNGTTYYYVVAAVNSAGSSANSAQVSAAPAAPVTNVSVNVDVLANRHFISPYIYGGAFPKDAAAITNSGMTVVRWGGNATSTYNWQLHTYNADNDYFFEDFNFCGFGNFANCSDGDSLQWIADVKAAGSRPLMTMPMLDWVAQSAETPGAGGNLHWTFSVSQDGAQCKTDPFNSDAGNGLKTDCATQIVASNADINRAYFPLLDGPPQAGDPANSVYRNQWAGALATAFGGGSCNIAYFALSSCHFYDMDNEIDIWGGTHVDVHPNQTTYNELRDVYLTEASKLKTWDPQAVRFGWVSCCWGPYWNAGPTGDRASHANVDFMPWWINEVRWNDQINNARTLDVLDLHAYPELNPNGLTLSQQQALTVKAPRDWWDPTYVTPAWFGSVSATNNEPSDNIPFRIPRVRALLNTDYPGTPLAFTEWNFGQAAANPSGAEADFSTALADADAYGILGRERVSFSTRWTAPDPANPNFQALKLYTNYDGANAGHGFNPISVAALHNADPDLFSVYAATNSTGNSLMLIVLNKDPNNAAKTTFTFSHFTASQFTSYTLSQASPGNIVASASQAWSSTMTFQPYTATLVVISGSTSSVPANQWDLNPDTIMVPAGGSVTLHPAMISGTGTVTLGTPSVTNGGITVTTTNSAVTAAQQGAIQVTAGNAPGFYSFSVPATDSGGVPETESGWIVVGKPGATLSKTAGDNQTGSAGTTLPIDLSVTLAPGSSGGNKAGASVFFTTSAGSLTNAASGNGEKIFSGSKVIAVTDSSGVAKVTLTLPGAPGPVTVTAEGPYGLGHPMTQPSFSETAN